MVLFGIGLVGVSNISVRIYQSHIRVLALFSAKTYLIKLFSKGNIICSQPKKLFMP